MLLAQGTAVGGWSFYVLDGRLRYAHNYLRMAHATASPSSEPVPAGRHELRFEFEPTGPPDFAHGKGAPGRAQLYVDRRLVGQAEVPMTDPDHDQPGGPDLRRRRRARRSSPTTGRRSGSRGVLHTVTVDLSGELITDSESEMRAAMARQ